VRARELSAIYEHVPGILFYISVEPDGEFRFLSMSNAGLAAMGLTRDQVVGARVGDVIPPPSRDLVLNHYRNAIQSGDTVRWREVSEYPAGRRVGEVAVTALYDAAGVATHLIGVVHDITERERLEETLRQREDRLAFLLQLNDALRPLSDPVEIQDVTVRLVGEHLGVNRVAYAVIDGSDFVVMADYNQGVAPLRGRWPIVAFGARLLDAQRRGESVMVSNVRTDARFSDDERATLLGRGVAAFLRVMLHKDGRWVASFGISSVTPRKWTAEERNLIEQTAERLWSAAERARAETALRAALQAERDQAHHRELHVLLETATQGIVSVDANGTIVTANRALEMMFGWPVGELIGQRIERLLPMALRERHQQDRSAYFAAPHPRPMGGGLLLVGERKDGSTFPVEVSLNHVGTRGGGRAYAFVSDITERQERTTELELRTAQLSRLASDLTLAEHHAREQIAKMLHDSLQQLLVIASLKLDEHIRGAGQASPDLIKKAKRDLDDAIVAARTLSFELSPPVLQHADLPEALVWLATWMHQKYGLKVHVCADPRATSPRKDVRTLLFESTRELLFNVVKHAKVDRVTLDLELDEMDQLCITVMDEGIGFDPAELRDRLKAGAVGWGLFSIRERVTLLGGRFDVDSTAGRGTRFRLVAPRGPTQNPASGPLTVRTEALGTPSTAAIDETSREALRILIVDDHSAMREVFSDFLRQYPALSVVGVASDGLEAIAQAQALRPDVILMDISMPHLDGIEATRRIHRELPFIQILGLSLQARTEARHAIEEAGAASYFVKGTDTLRLIEHLLGEQARRTSGHTLNPRTAPAEF